MGLSAVRLTTKEFQYSSNTISWHLLLSECAACFSCGFLATSEPETQTLQDLAVKDANFRHPTSVVVVTYGLGRKNLTIGNIAQ